MHEALRHKLLGMWSDLVTGHPRKVLALALLLAAGSVTVTVLRLEFRPNRNDLIAKDLDWNQRFIAWQSTFPGSYDMYVVVDRWGDADTPTPEAAATANRVIDTLGPRLAADPHIKQAVWGFDPRRVSPKAMRLLPMEEFTPQLRTLTEAAKVLDDPDVWALLGTALRGVGPGEDARVRPLRELLQLSAKGWEYLTTPNGRLMVIRVTPQEKAQSLNALEPTIAAVRGHIADVLAEHPGAAAGLTGIEVVEADETVAATRDSTLASIIAVVLIAAVLIAAFHSVRMPLLIVGALLIGVAWSFGFLTLAVGHLQVISVIFTVMLLGLGVAFGIHLAARFEMVRHEHLAGAGGFITTMRDAIQTVGPGIITGAVTTAAAFCTTLLTDFTGVAEMGLIAAAGIMLCLLAMFSVFPAVLRLVKPGRRHVVHLDDRWFHLYEDRWIAPMYRRPWVTLGVWMAAGAAACVAVSQMRFDYNLTNLLPRGIESVQWQERITEDGEQSIFFGISVAESPAAARQRVEAFHAAAAAPGSLIGEVRGYGLLQPADEAAKLAMLDAARAEVGPVLERVLAAPSSEGGLLGGMFGRVGQVRQEIAGAILAALDLGPLRASDLPEAVMRSYVSPSRDGQGARYAIEVYPRLPEGVTNPLDPAFLPRFVSQMQAVDPHITGVITQIFFSGDLIKRAYLIAGVLALAAVFCLVVLDFQSVTDALLAMLPVTLGFAVTFGVLWLIGQQINPANVIVLPLMFGIGVDFGVHMLHRYRVDDQTRPLGLAAGTGKGIVLTALTTIIGFAAMLIARHRGIASLGLVLSMGVAFTLLACLTLMPAILELRTRRRGKQGRRPDSPSPTNGPERTARPD